MIWYVEEGIGEDRAICVTGDEIIAARIQWPEDLAPGHIEDAILVSRTAGSSRGTARFANGAEVLVDKLPRDAREGAAIRLQVVRSAMGEAGRLKRAHARPTDLPPASPTLAQAIAATGAEVQTVRRFPVAGWADIIADTFSGEIAFDGGTLVFSPTPAMVLVDVDGILPPRELAVAAAKAITCCIRQFDLGGSIGIDFPTLEAKADRRMVDLALAEGLADWPHERTSMNGFGFVQMVSRLSRPSLLHRAVHYRSRLAARQILRQAETVMEPGALLLTAHPDVTNQLHAHWQAELARRTGREIRLKSDPGLALEGGFAQAVPL